MKILFVFPKWEKFLESRPELEETLSGYNVGNFNMPSIGITTVAALTPSEYEISLVDDHLEKIDYNTDADLIAITCFTPQATRGYEIADAFRERGKKVVMGGIHPTLKYEDAGTHADTVIIGEAEQTWRIFLDDFKNQKNKKYYFPGELPKVLINQPLPRRDLFEKKGYILMDVVQTARGCPFQCDCCVIPECYGRSLRFRPVREIVREIIELNCEIFYFADDHLLFGKGNYARKLFKEMIKAGLNKKFYISGSLTMMAHDIELLKLAHQAGCQQLYIVYGFCPISIKGLSCEGDIEIYEATQRIIDSGIQCFASFGLGFDFHDKGIFRRILNYTEKTQIELAEFFIVTPFPQTPFYKRLIKEGRLFHEKWEKYNGSYVVFKPKKMSEDELLNGYIECWKEFYKRYTPESFDAKIVLKYYGTTIKKYREEKKQVLISSQHNV